MSRFGEAWGPGYAVFQCPNLGCPAADWYHDHTLGMTRLNAHAGPAGFYIIRSGSLFSPDSREFFDGILGPYIPDTDISPIWNPEFFATMMMVNGKTWPFQTIEQRRYRLRLLNSCQAAPGVWVKRLWMEPVAENPALGATEIWEFYNATADAHPIHVHEVLFEVLNRQAILVNDTTQELQVVPGSLPTPPEPWETGFKDTVIAYPGQVTRIRAQFTTPGQFVWHCHIVEHEDNEMMRPYRIGPVQPGQPGS